MTLTDTRYTLELSRAELLYAEEALCDKCRQLYAKAEELRAQDDDSWKSYIQKCEAYRALRDAIGNITGTRYYGKDA